jgi:hypothetical protein
MDSQKPEGKKYDPTEDFKEGSFIDAKDSVNRWCVAIVRARNDATRRVKVRFDGWNGSWDVTYSIDSSKVAPFR